MQNGPRQSELPPHFCIPYDGLGLRKNRLSISCPIQEQ